MELSIALFINQLQISLTAVVHLPTLSDSGTGGMTIELSHIGTGGVKFWSDRRLLPGDRPGRASGGDVLGVGILLDGMKSMGARWMIKGTRAGSGAVGVRSWSEPVTNCAEGRWRISLSGR